MKYGSKIIVWHECYVTGGSDWSIIDILTNWPNKNCNFDFFVNKKHEGINLLQKSLNKNCKFNYYNSVIEKINNLKKTFLFKYLLNVFILRKLFTFYFLITTFFSIHKKLKNKNFDYILINNGGYPGGLTSYLVIISSFILKKKVAMIIRNFPAHNYKKNLSMFIVRLIVIFFNCKLISVSKSLKKSLENDAGIDRKKIKVIYNGISLQNKKKFLKEKKRKIKNYSVGIFGRIESRKGHHHLIKAWKLVEKKLPNLNLYIVGNGEMKYITSLKNIININKLNKKKIIWLNYTNNIYTLLKQIDLVVVPSVKFESFGRIAVEAMALKKPIITSNFGGLKEVNINKKTGFTINVKDKKILSNKIIELMINKNKRKLFGSRGEKNYKKNFTSSMMSKKYYKFVKNNLQK